MSNDAENNEGGPADLWGHWAAEREPAPATPPEPTGRTEPTEPVWHAEPMGQTEATFGGWPPPSAPTAQFPAVPAPSGADPPQFPPPPPPWVPSSPGGAIPGGGWGSGQVPPPPLGTTYSPYSAPPQPYAAATRPALGSRTFATIAAVLAIAAAGVVGAGAEYAVNHHSSNLQGLGNSPSTGTGNTGEGSGNTGTGNTGIGSGNTGTGNTGTGSGNTGTGSANDAPVDVNTAAIAAKVDPGILDIDTTLAGGGAAAGTGMVLTSSGLVLTNNHVIENATTITAEIVGTQRRFTANVIGYSVTDDVALLQLQNASGLKTIATANSSGVTAGQAIVAIGNAGGTGGLPSAVAGRITAIDQTITAGDSGTLPETLHGMFETDADIQPGDSGGPMVNVSGEVIGMDTAAAVQSGFGNTETDEGYAITINQALTLVNEIKSGKSSSTISIGARAVLGVEVQDGSDSSNGFGAAGGGSGVAGAYVQSVESGSAADNAGIGAGDTIESVNGSTISSAEDLSNALIHFSPGASVTVGWVDEAGTSHTATVQLTAGPPL